jgi:Rieske Fe-S protein
MKVSEIPPNSGMTGKIGDKPVAVFNTGEGLIVLENICTHMRCQTHWNSTELTWDCPCHGSRYKSDGSVLRGPAPKDLKKLSFRVEGDEIELD